MSHEADAITYTCQSCGDIHDDIQEMTDPQGDGHLICLRCSDRPETPKSLYNKTYIVEKIDKAMKSLSFLKANLKDAPEWMHVESDDDPLKQEIPYSMKQLQIITDHMEARDRAAKHE